MKREVKVGIFAITVLLVGWGVVHFLKGAEIFGSANTYYANYEQVGGLQPASHVVISGVTVGAVSSVTLDADPAKGVQVAFTVNKRYKIPADSKARIFSDGIMGGKALEIVYGTSSEFVPKNGTIDSAVSTDLFEIAGSEIDFINEKVSAVVDGLTQTLETVNQLLAENTAALSNIVKNVDGVTGNVNAMLVSERANLEEALASLSKFSKSLGDNAEQVDGMIDNLHKISADFAQTNLAAELEGVANNLNAILAKVEDDKGSVGKMLNDATLYNNLSSVSDNLSAVLEDLKENPHRYINISVLGSNPYKKVEKAKAKAEKKAIKRADEAAERLHEQQMKQKTAN